MGIKLTFSNLTENNLKKINGKFALILGLTPSKGARSPKLWNKVYKWKKISIRMFPADLKKKNLKKFIKYLKKNPNFIGGSVTAPYKVEVMKYLDNLDKTSKKIGSINTILKKKNKLYGFNTDYFGATNSLLDFKDKKKILVLGCGGAGKAVILALINNFKSSKFFFYNRNKTTLKNYLSKLAILKKIKILKRISDINFISNFDLIVNTTSIGFDSWIKSQKGYYNLKALSPFSSSSKIKNSKNKNYKSFIKKNSMLIKKDTNNLIKFFKSNKKADIFDIIYFPKKTKLLKYGNKKCKNGLQMNLDQAVKAFQIVNNFKNFNKIKLIMSQNG